MPAVDGDARWGGADVVLAARPGGGQTKPCAAHLATRVVKPVAVVVPPAALAAARQFRGPSSSTRSATVEDMDDAAANSGGGLWQNTLRA